MSATAVSPDGLYTAEEMRASFPYCPVCECETIPLRNGACAWCDTLVAPKREEAEQREHEAERHRVYKLSHKDQINKRRRELRRERKGHVRRYRRACDVLSGDSRLTTAQVMPSGEVTEGEHTPPVALPECAPSVTSSAFATPDPSSPSQSETMAGAARHLHDDSREAT